MNKTLKIGIIVDDLFISDYIADLITWSQKIDGVDFSNFLYLVDDNENPLPKKSKLQNILSMSLLKQYLRKSLKNFFFHLKKEGI